MTAREFMDFLHILEKMKCNTRHGWTSTGRHESVAEHSYRLCAMAFLLRDEFPGIDMEKVLHMCIVHDWGEAVTGDIPSFLKTDADEATETDAVGGLTARLPDKKAELDALFAELTALETPEAKLYKALDRIEAVIQHNEAPLDTWIELERTLNLEYGVADCANFPFMAELREIAEERLPEQPSEKEIARALEREAAEIEKAVPKGAYVVALCVEGREMSSTELAGTLDAAMGAGASKLCFIIGGSFGLHESVKRSADLRLSMSRMTFPHHLARVMLAEQVYRAFTIMNGGRYHK